MSEERIIKKYPNRRLYDSKISRYITLEQIHNMVLNKTPFKVMDQQSGKDITRNILLQIIMEQEATGKPLLNVDILSDFIRRYNENTRQGFSLYLQLSLQFFADHQATLHTQMDDAFSKMPVNYWTKALENNLKIWQEMQRQMFKAVVPPNNDKE